MEGQRHTRAHCFPPAQGAHSLLSSERLGPGALHLSPLGQEVPEDQCRPRACSGRVPRLWSRDSPTWPGKGVPPGKVGTPPVGCCGQEASGQVLLDQTRSVMCLSAHSVASDSVPPHGLQPARLLCPWGVSRREDWGGWPCPPPGDLPAPGIEPGSPTAPALQALSLPGSRCVGEGSPGIFGGVASEWRGPRRLPAAGRAPREPFTPVFPSGKWP